MCRVLILEDDPFIALDLQAIVEGEGHEVVRVCSAAAEAARLRDYDFALLDVDVADGTSYGFATALTKRRIPFAFVSGSRHGDLPAHLRQAAFVQKPFSERSIVGLLPANRRAA
jgi:CheY-like chemotaxis protein